jgi:hypothetical protein
MRKSDIAARLRDFKAGALALKLFRRRNKSSK